MAKKQVKFSDEVTRDNLAGLDPALHTGYAALVDSGQWNFTASKKRNNNKRHLHFYSTIKQYCIDNSIKGLMVETPTMHRANAAILLLNLQGHIKLIAEELDIELDFVDPKTVKKFIAGNGNADKEQVILAIKNKYGKTVGSDDEADALAIFYYALRKHKL